MLLMEACEKIEQLKRALVNIEAIQAEFIHTVSNVRSEIRAAVHQQLDHLWGQEVILQAEVDRTVTTSQECLLQQQTSLAQALGFLQAHVSRVQCGLLADDGLADILQQLKSLALAPEIGAPCVTFAADHTRLRESIQNYGRVDCRLPAAPDIMHLDLMSQPVKIKEASCVEFCTGLVPQLPTCTKFWLQKEVAVPGSGQQVNSGLSGQASTEGKPYLAQPRAEVSLHSAQSVRKSLEKWLKSVGGPTGGSTPINFQHIPTDNATWLTQAYQQLASLQEGKQPDFFSHVSRESSSWLSRAYCKQQASAISKEDKSDFFSHISRDCSRWLLKPSVGFQNDDCSRPVLDANNSCQVQAQDKEQTVPLNTTLAAPSATGHVIDALYQNISWPEPSFTDRSGGSCLSTNQLTLKTCLTDLPYDCCSWLLPGAESKQASSQQEAVSLFSHLPDVRDPVWLKADKRKEAADLNQWLHKPELLSQSLLTPVPTSSGNFGFSTEWLSGRCEDDLKQHHELIDESEGWSICSHCSGTDHYAHHDVAVADEYFTKWLIRM